MMLPPGIHSGYKVGDIVFLAFTDNEINRPVVLGQLYVDNLTNMTKADNAGYVSCDFLEVEDTATLKNMTGDTVSCKSLTCTKLICNNEEVDLKALKNKVSELEGKVNTLTAQLNALKAITQ
jgi:hypothetical protein